MSAIYYGAMIPLRCVLLYYDISKMKCHRMMNEEDSIIKQRAEEL